MLTAQEFAQAYRDYFDKTVGFMYTRCGSHVEAEEYAQEAWSRAWIKREEIYAAQEFLSAWVCRVAINVMLTKKRHEVVEAKHIATFDEQCQPQQINDLEKILSSVRGLDQQILVDHYIYGFTTTEISNKLKPMKASSVRVRLMRVRRRVHKLLTSHKRT